MKNLAPRNVLLIDDERIFLRTLSEFLITSGRDVGILTAENGEKALEILKSARVDLIVTDLKMPVMDGFELISTIKESHPDMPVIAMSAFFNPEVEGKLLALGVSQHVEKPFNLETLENKIFGNG